MQRFIRNAGTVFLTFAMIINSTMPVMALGDELSADTEAVDVQVYNEENGTDINNESDAEESIATKDEAKAEDSIEAEDKAKAEDSIEAEDEAKAEDSIEAEDVSDAKGNIDTDNEENKSDVNNDIDQSDQINNLSSEVESELEVPSFLNASEDFTIEDGILLAYTGTDTEVVIPEGVLVIGDGSRTIFTNNSAVTAVTISDSVTEIADKAFYACTELTEINFSDKINLQKIGKSAFFNTRLTSLVIPEGVTEIGDSALYGSTLQAISLPATLEKLGDTSVYYAFASTSGTAPKSSFKVEIAQENRVYSEKNGAVYDKEEETLFYYPSGITGSYEISDGTKIIAPYAFRSSALQQVVIADSVEEIGENAFSGAQVTSISIPGSVKQIGKNAFYSAKMGTVNLNEGLQIIEQYAFGGGHFTSLTIPKTVTAIGSGAFEDFGGEIRILNAETNLGSGFIEYYKNITVYGLENSTAQTYVSELAAEKGDRCKVKFELLQEETETEVQSVSLDKNTLSLSVGNTETLTGSVSPLNATNPSLTWNVSDETIVTVDQRGIVKAVAEGSAIVQATSVNGLFDQCEVIVTAASDFVIQDNVLVSYTGSEESITIPDSVTIIGNGTDAVFGNDSKVVSVTIPGSVTKISDKAFYYANTLKEINFSSEKNLKEIGASSFQLATALKEIEIPEGVTEIGTQAFVGTHSLTSVSLPATLVRFGAENDRFDAAFIYAASKGHDTLTEINVAEGNPVYASKNGVVYSADGKNLLFCPHARMGSLTVAEGTERIAPYAMAKGKIQQVILPNSLLKIDDSAFYETKLMSITIPGSVKSIGKLGFFNAQIRSITFEEGLETIGENAFSQSRITGISIPASVKEIKRNAFDFEYGVNHWIQIKGNDTIFDNEFIPYYYGISVYAQRGSSAEQYIKDKQEEKGASCKLIFYEVSSFIEVNDISLNQETAQLKRTETAALTVTINPDSSQATLIAWSSSKPEVATVDQNGLVTAVQPGVTEITAEVSGHIAKCVVTVEKEEGESDFTIDEEGKITGFIGLDMRDLVIPETVNGKKVTGIADKAFYRQNDIKTLIIGGHVKEIGNGAFQQCTGITAVALNEGIERIGESVFNGCDKIESIVIPEGIEVISANAFTSCSMLQEITLPSSLKTIGEAAFRSCTKLTEISLPEGLVSIEKQAFLGCPISTLHLPASLEKLGNEYIGEVFEIPGQNPANTTMKTITVEAGNTNFTAYDGLLYDATGTKVMFCPRGRTEAEIREGVTRINDYAFFMCFDLVSVKMPSTLEEVGSQAFHYCEALTDCTLPQGLLIVENSAFFGCEKWADFTIPSSVQRIDAYGFTECAAKEIVVPEGIKRIEAFTFWGYEDTLEKITLPSTLEYIGDSAFAWTKKVKEIVIPEGVTEIGSQAFGRCDALESITLPSTLKIIGKEAFIGSSESNALKEIFISSNVTSIGENTFKNYGDNLTIVTDQYGDAAAAYAVANGHLLRIEGDSEADFVVEDGVLVRYEGSASEIVIPNTVIEIGEGALAEENLNSSLKKVIIPSTVTKIGKEAFHGSGVTEVLFSEGSQLKTIGESAFAYCTKLPAISLPETVTEIGASAFDGDSLLGEIAIPASVTSIGDKAFNVCTGLRKVTFAASSNLKTIGEGAFYNCFRLSELDIPEGVTEVGDQAFRISKTFERISLPSTLTKLGSSVSAVFAAVGNSTQSGSDSLLEINIAEGNTVYSSWNGSVYTADKKSLLYVPSAKTGTVIVKEGTEAIGNNALIRSKLDHIALPESLKSIGENAFSTSSISSVEIPASVESIGNNAFFWCSNLKSVLLNDGLKKISYGAFSESPLSSVTIPATVESVGEYAFDNVQSWVFVKGRDTILEKDFISYYKPLTIYGEKGSTAESYVTETKAEKGESCKLSFALLDTFVPVTQIDLNTKSIQLKRFETFNLEVTVLPDDATHKDMIFKSLNSDVATVDSIGKITAISSGTTEIQVLSSDGPSVSCTVVVEKGETDSDYTINNQGEITGYYGTDKDLIFPDTVNEVTVVGIADYAFSKNNRITSITLPSNIKYIGDGAFENCINLGEINFSTGLQSIGKEAFHNCGYLSEVHLPEGLKNMGEGVFMNCEKLERVSFPSTLKEIPAKAFLTCWRLLKVELPEGVEVIGEDAFYECEAMETLVLPNTLKNIQEGAFTACVSLEEARIPEGVVSIEKEAFMSCTDMKTIYLPSTLKTFGNEYAGDVFEQSASVLGCDHLETITVAEGNSVYSSKDNLLYSADGKTLLFCPRGRTSASVQEGTVIIGDSAFFFCLKLESVTLPSSIRKLDKNAFHLCEKLKEINLPQGLETIEYGALAECVSLTELKIPSGVTSIGTFALSGSNLTSIELPSSVVSLGDRVFSASLQLKKVTIPSMLKNVGEDLFTGCNKALCIITDSSNSTIYRYAIANNIPVQVTGSSGGSSGGKGSSSKSKSTAEETKTTKSVDEVTGAVTEKKIYSDGTSEKTVTEKDGTVTKVIIKPDGSISNTEKRADGTQITTEVSSSGKVTAKVQLSKSLKKEKGVRVIVPTGAKTGAGLVAVLVRGDGTREIVKTSIPLKDGIAFTADSDMDVEIIDNSKKFSDISSSDWHADAVQFVAARELFAGTGKEQFSPNEDASRAMIFTVLARLDGQDVSGGETWYAKASEWAVSQGISDGLNPDSKITREQLVSMLYRYAGTPKATSELGKFYDADAVSSWSADAMRWAVENHIISGKGNGNLEPSASATRAEIAVMMQNFITN